MAKNLKTDIDEELVRKLANLMDETGLTEIEYGIEGINIRVSKAANYAVAAPAPTADGQVATEIAEVDAASHPGVLKRFLIHI